MQRSAELMSRHGFLRLARSLMVTATVFSLAAGGHMLGGGIMPPASVVLALMALVLIPVTWLAGRQLSLTSLLVILGSGQFMLHHAFAAFSVAAPCTTSTPAGAHAHHAGMSGMHCASADPASIVIHAATPNVSVAMFAAHLVAVAVTAWLLWKGEVALWQLLAWLRPLIPTPTPVLMLPGSPRSLTRTSVFMPVLWRMLRVDSPRGPPATRAYRHLFPAA